MYKLTRVCHTLPGDDPSAAKGVVHALVDLLPRYFVVISRRDFMMDEAIQPGRH